MGSGGHVVRPRLEMESRSHKGVGARHVTRRHCGWSGGVSIATAVRPLLTSSLPVALQTASVTWCAAILEPRYFRPSPQQRRHLRTRAGFSTFPIATPSRGARPYGNQGGTCVCHLSNLYHVIRRHFESKGVLPAVSIATTTCDPPLFCYYSGPSARSHSNVIT